MSNIRRPLVNGLAWDRDRIIVETDEAIGKIDKPHLSASTSKAIHQCPARHVADRLLPEKLDLFAPAPLGNAAHTVLERLFQMPATRRDRRAATTILLALAREYTEKYPEVMSDPITYERWKEEVSRCYLGIFDMEDPTQINTTHQERKLDGVLVGGVPFKGFIDRQDEVTVRGRTGASVKDYKTGKVRKPGHFGDDHGDQIRLYAKAVETLDGEMPVEGAVLYTTHREVVSVPLGKKYMDPTLAAFHDSWVDLRSYVHERTFPTKTSALCGWCPLVNSCPTAKKEGKVDRVGTAPTEVELGIPLLRPGAKRRLDNLDDGYDDVHGVEDRMAQIPEPPVNEFIPEPVEQPVQDVYGGNYLPVVEPDESEFPGYRKPVTAPEHFFDPYAAEGEMSAAEYRALKAAEAAQTTAGAAIEQEDPDGLHEPYGGAECAVDPYADLVPEPLVEPDDDEPPVDSTDAYADDDHEDDDHENTRHNNQSVREQTLTPSHNKDNRAVATTSEEDAEMNDQMWREGKPYDGAEIDGHLSLNSYASTAVFGVTELATEVLAENGQKMSKSMVSALTSVFARVILGAQYRITFGDMDWQSGANTRVRGALRTVIKTMPLPFGSDLDEWENWRLAATRRCVAIAAVAIDLYEQGPTDDDISVLVRDAVSTNRVPQAA